MAAICRHMAVEMSRLVFLAWTSDDLKMLRADDFCREIPFAPVKRRTRNSKVWSFFVKDE